MEEKIIYKRRFSESQDVFKIKINAEGNSRQNMYAILKFNRRHDKFSIVDIKKGILSYKDNNNSIYQIPIDMMTQAVLSREIKKRGSSFVSFGTQQSDSTNPTFLNRSIHISWETLKTILRIR